MILTFWLQLGLRLILKRVSKNVSNVSDLSLCEWALFSVAQIS